MNGITDLEVYLGPSKEPRDTTGDTSRHDVQARIDGSGLFRGEVTLNHARLGEVLDDPSQYGKLLGAQLLCESVSRALQRALAKSSTVRLRLSLDGDIDERYGIRWERMYVPIDGESWPVATAPRLLFSRCLPENMEDAEPPDEAVFRLLFAIANPSDLAAKNLAQIDVNAEVLSLVEALRGSSSDQRLVLTVLPGRTELSAEAKAAIASVNAELVTGPATLNRIGEFAHNSHGVHVIAHGNLINTAKVKNQGLLTLEASDGTSAVVTDEELKAWVHDELRLVFLQACRGAAGRALVGLAPRLVASGVPAVVGMQDFVEITDARNFTRTFYRCLTSDGIVDAAVNSGRQQIRSDASRDNWSIPALFLRVRDGRLWQPDPLREVLRTQKQLLDSRPQVLTPFPIQAIENLHGLQLDTRKDAAGPVRTLTEALPEKLGVDGALVCLTGPPGCGKSAFLEWMHHRAAQQVLDAAAGAAIPVRLTLKELGSERFPSGAVVGCAARALRSVSGQQNWFSDARLSREFTGRPFLLLIDGDEDAAAEEQRRGLSEVLRFRERNPKLRVLVTMNDSALEAWGEPANAGRTTPTVLVIQPMASSQVRDFLLAMKSGLWSRIVDSRFSDIAGIPWLLTRMMIAAQGSATPDALSSRARLLESLVMDSMNNLVGSPVPRSVALTALSRIAWQNQWTRCSRTAGPDLYEILASVRGSRELALASMREALVDRCRILSASGEDGVRFSYPHLQAYFAARYLRDCPDCHRHIEDITASLGRLTRVRWWEETLVMLAGMTDSPGELIAAILSGSAMTEGEQVFLAVRCCLETRNGSAQAGSEIVEQLVDTLIWRSAAGRQRPYSDRRRSVAALGDLRSGRAIPHLLELACDPAADGDGKRYEVSGLRMEAVTALRLMPVAVKQHVAGINRPEVSRVLEAWWGVDLTQDSTLQPLIEILKENKPSISPLAAFALADADTPLARNALAEQFQNRNLNPNTRWAIADAIGKLDATWVRDHVIRSAQGTIDVTDDVHLCYLIGKTGLAEPGSVERKYLDWCFASGNSALQARAIRAAAHLRDESIRPVCEAIVRRDWARVRSLGLVKLDGVPNDTDFLRLCFAAVEALRTVGNADSIAALREGRRTMTSTLDWLTYDVAEEIYWRVTGGLANETAASGATRH